MTRPHLAGFHLSAEARDLNCVPSTVVKTARRFLMGGKEALLDQRVFNGRTNVDARFLAKLESVLFCVPTEAGAG